MDKRALVNLHFMYFCKFNASSSVSKHPILKNVSVCPIPGFATTDGANVSPKLPVPLAFGISILYLSKFFTSLMYDLFMYLLTLFWFYLPTIIAYLVRLFGAESINIVCNFSITLDFRSFVCP